jgi:SAM-dependent methyltransferase
MPELDWNLKHWSNGYRWVSGGEEWSDKWGGSEAQWFGSLYPRLHRFLPAQAILEIAPGFGRWTKFLLPACQDYIGIDLSAKCIEACTINFASAGHARFLRNDGLSLDAAPEGHFDLVFTFDSLVHVEMDVLDRYIPQILRKLAPNGAAFVHHSNRKALPLGTKNSHQRAESVSAETFAMRVSENGGKILVQERINWGEANLSDCLTLFARKEHTDTAPPAQIENPNYMEEADRIHDTLAPYIRGRADPLSETYQ